MKIDFRKPDSWDLANEAVLNLLKDQTIEAGTQVRLAKGLAAGLFETFNATASFLSHRKTVGFVEGQSWAQQALLAPLLRDGHEVKTFSVEAMQNPSEVLETLGGETSVFFFPEDNAITGEKFDFAALEEALILKRIFCVRLSHHGSLVTKNLKPYSVRVCSITPELSVALLGSRYKTPPQIAPWQQWDVELALRDVENHQKSFAEDSALIEKFESSLAAPFQRVLNTNLRVWDRAVLTTKEKGGEQILLELQEKVGRKLGSEWADTLQLCRWSATMQDLEWWKTKLTPDEIRGFVSLSLEAVRDSAVQSYFQGRS